MPNRLQERQLNQKDRQILLLIFRYCILTTRMLHSLLATESVPHHTLGPRGRDGKVRPHAYGFGLQALYKRLRGLLQAGLIDRRFVFPLSFSSHSGAPEAVYSLHPRSATVVAQLARTDPRQVRSRILSDRVQMPFLNHALGISGFRVVLELVSAQPNARLAVLFWRQGRDLKDSVITSDTSGGSRYLSVYPDAAFALETRPGALKLYFLEYDRGTMPIASSDDRSSLMRKFQAYLAYRNTGRFQELYTPLIDPFAWIEPLRQRGQEGLEPVGSPAFPRFTVLFVMPEAKSSPSRIDNTIRLLSSMPLPYRSKSLFWFTEETQITIKHPQLLVRSIWKTASSEPGLRSILD